jgi:HK97 family phage portal protein
VKGFHLLDPNKVTPVIESKSRELWYRVQSDTGDYYVHNMDMIHVKHVSTTGGLAGLSYMGISPLKVLEGALDFDAKVSEFTLDQIENAVRASFILSMAAMVDDTKKAAVLESFRSFYAENGGVLLEEQGSKIQELKGGNNLDTKLLDVKKVTRARVAEVLGLPDPDVTSYNSIEQEQMRYVQQTIVGIATQYEAEFDRKLLTFEDRRKGLHFRFNLGVLMRADSSGRMDYYFKGIRTMVLKPNECRAWEELPPEPGGEKLYCSRDLSPVGEVQPTTTPQGGQRNG